jgi:hypothetical protein
VEVAFKKIKTSAGYPSKNAYQRNHSGAMFKYSSKSEVYTCLSLLDPSEINWFRKSQLMSLVANRPSKTPCRDESSRVQASSRGVIRLESTQIECFS